MGIKHFLISIVAVGFLTGCGGKDTEKIREDSIRVADSIAAVEAARAAEQARLDSIRQDSIKMAEEELANRLTILTFCKYNPDDRVMDQLGGSQIYAKLKALGFEKTSQTTEYHGDEGCLEPWTEEITTFEREKYGYFIKVRIDGVDKKNPAAAKLGSIEITFSDSAQRDDFLQTALSNRFKKKRADYYEGPNAEECYWNGSFIEVTGNTVKIIENFEC